MVSSVVQPPTALVWGAGVGGEILPNGGALGGDSEALSTGESVGVDISELPVCLDSTLISECACLAP